jgi:hypothetical protein
MCTLRDFTELCRALDLRIEACAALTTGKPPRPIDPERAVENWRSEAALFLLSRRDVVMAPRLDVAEPDRAKASADLVG